MCCSIEGCVKAASSLGWCRMHYTRWYRHGDPLHPVRRTVTGSLAQRLWARTKVVDEHVLWTGSVNAKGYGYLSAGSRSSGHMLAHVAAWTVTYGLVPKGVCVLHRCDIPACVNPSCLFLGTRADNNIDMAAKGRHYNGKKTHCIRGHEFTASNTIPNTNPKHRKCKSCWGAGGIMRRRSVPRA